MQKRGTAQHDLNARVGRPEGARTRSPHDRIKGNLRRYYEALDRSAAAGNADAARLCFDIAAHPERYPLPAPGE